MEVIGVTMKKGFPMILSLFLLAACSSQSTTSKTTSTNVTASKTTTSNATTSSPTQQIQNNASNQVQNNPSNNQVEGYIYSNSADVTFIQYTNTDGRLNGSYYNRQESSNNQLLEYNSPLTGYINGNNITFTLTAYGATYSGNLSNGEINLAVPQKDGTIVNDQLKPATLNDFNAAVSQIQSKISNDQQAAQQAQQTANLNNQLSNVEDNINTLMQSIPKDEQSLQNDVQNTEKDINSEETDLGTVTKDEQKVMKESPDAQQTIADTNQVTTDANQLTVDDNQISTDNNQFQIDEKTLQGDLSSLSSNFQSMVNLANQLNAVIPNYLPKNSDVTQIVNKGNSIDQSTTAAMNGFIAKSKQMVDSANNLSDKSSKHYESS